jgi:hypothetical protein
VHAETDADPEWVAHLTERSLPEAEAALLEARRAGGLYRYLTQQHGRAGRESYVEIDAPLELHALVRLQRPAHVVEIGVSSGVSSAYLLDALARNGAGRLHSIDRPSFERPRPAGAPPSRESWSLPAGKGPGWGVPPRLRRTWDLRLGDKADVLPILAEQIPRIDLLVYDVPHECSELRREIRSLQPLLRSGAIVIIDHGPGGGCCPAISSWARTWGTEPERRRGLGLFAAHRPLGLAPPEPGRPAPLSRSASP